MILSNNAFNWAMLRSGKGLGEFLSSLTPEREEKLLKQYNEWRRSKGLLEEKAIEAPSPPEPRKKPTTHAASNNDIVSIVKGVVEDDLSTLINEVAAEMEEEEAEEAALVHNALDGADEIVEEAELIPDDEIMEEASVSTGVDEAIAEDAMPIDTGETIGEDAAPEVVTTLAVPAEAMGADPAVEEQRVAFAAVIHSLPKEADPALYSRIKGEYGNQTLTLTQAALQEATKRHRRTAAIRAFLAWLNENEGCASSALVMQFGESPNPAKP